MQKAKACPQLTLRFNDIIFKMLILMFSANCYSVIMLHLFLGLLEFECPRRLK